MKSRRLAVGAAVLAALAVGIGAVSWHLGSELVRPVLHPVFPPENLEVRLVSIPAEGHAVAGWYLEKAEDAPVVLLLPGIRADRSSMVSRARLLLAHGFSVLLVDLQAHGETPGEAITLGFRESGDVRAAIRWLRTAVPTRRVGAIGCSLGGAAILLGAQPSGLDAVVLEAVYPRVSTAVENRIRMRLGPLAPILAPLLLVQLGPRLGISIRDLEPIRSIDKLGAPVLIVAGAKDEHTTLAESKELYAAAAEPKRFWVLPGAKHEDFLVADPIGYESGVVGFLSEHLQVVPSTATRIAGPGEMAVSR